MPNLGKKYECFSCGTKFYDLGRPEAVCPKCGANQKDARPADEPVAPRPRRPAPVMIPPDEEGEIDEGAGEEEGILEPHEFGGDEFDEETHELERPPEGEGEEY